MLFKLGLMARIHKPKIRAGEFPMAYSHHHSFHLRYKNFKTLPTLQRMLEIVELLADFQYFARCRNY